MSYNTTCRKCGKPAYQGLGPIKCSNGHCEDAEKPCCMDEKGVPDCDPGRADVFTGDTIKALEDLVKALESGNYTIPEPDPNWQPPDDWKDVLDYPGTADQSKLVVNSEVKQVEFYGPSCRGCALCT